MNIGEKLGLVCGFIPGLSTVVGLVKLTIYSIQSKKLDKLSETDNKIQNVAQQLISPAIQQRYKDLSEYKTKLRNCSIMEIIPILNIVAAIMEWKVLSQLSETRDTDPYLGFYHLPPLQDKEKNKELIKNLKLVDETDNELDDKKDLAQKVYDNSKVDDNPLSNTTLIEKETLKYEEIARISKKKNLDNTIHVLKFFHLEPLENKKQNGELIITAECMYQLENDRRHNRSFYDLAIELREKCEKDPNFSPLKELLDILNNELADINKQFDTVDEKIWNEANGEDTSQKYRRSNFHHESLLKTNQLYLTQAEYLEKFLD